MLPIELPSFEATWWPLMMEAIPGSGEAITVAILARAASGQSQVRQCVQPNILSGLFGSAGKGVQTLVGTTVIDLQAQLDEGVPVEKVDLTYGGFHFGHARDGVARDLNEVFDVAVRLSAAFGQSSFGHQIEAADSSREAFDDWAQRVRDALLLHEANMALRVADFDVRVKLDRKTVRFGLLRAGYAANFGVLRPGHISGDIRSLKVKVFDLEALRRDQLSAPDYTDVLLGCPPAQALGAFTRREVESFGASLAFIEAEARARNVDLVRCTSQDDAAAHIRRRLAA